MADYQQKILDEPALHAAVRKARADGRTIVVCHGCFDIVHPGHVRYLQFARTQGDVLIVTVTGDADILKGGDRPYIPQELRAENLAALMFVDHVHITSAPTAVDVLELIKPDAYVKGSEYEHSKEEGFLAEKRVVETHGGRIIFSSGEIVFSSTALLEPRATRPDFESYRHRMLCRRHNMNLADMTAYIERFRDLNIAVVGDTVVDRYVLCDALGVASESPVMSLVQRDERSYVGGAAIVARHLAGLGAHAFLLTNGAKDDTAAFVRSVLANESVETHFVSERPDTVQKTRYLVDDQKVLKVNRGEHRPLDSLAEKHAATILEQQSRVADAIIFCDFGYGMITGGLLSRVLPTLRQNVRILAADVSGARANLLNFRNVDLLCPTEREVRLMLNDFGSGLSAVAWRLLDQTQARHLFITMEKRGMVVFQRRSQDRTSTEWSGRLQSEQLPSFANTAVDRLGCGDAMLATSTLALTAGASVLESAYLGNAAAAIELSLPGNHPLDDVRLVDWLEGRGELMRSKGAQPQSPPEEALAGSQER